MQALVMHLRDIRTTVIKAIFSDDILMEKLVLKGGNAIDLVYNIGARSSLVSKCISSQLYF